MTQLLDDPRYYVNEEKELYDSLVADHGEEAVDLFIENFGPGLLDRFEDVYRGHYDNEKQFAEDYVDMMYDTRDIPTIIMYNVDWQDVWNTDLQYVYIFDQGHVFHREF